MSGSIVDAEEAIVVVEVLNQSLEGTSVFRIESYLSEIDDKRRISTREKKARAGPCLRVLVLLDARADS